MAGKTKNKENKKLSEKEIATQIRDLKIEMLRQPTKKRGIKKAIARLLTMEKIVKSEGNSK